MITVIRREVEALDRDLPLFNVKALSRHVDEALMVPRLCGALFGSFGATGHVLAIVGLYAVVNYSVRSRTREIGLRMALGACPNAVASMVARKGLALVAAGLGIGMVVAYSASRIIVSFLYGVTPTDPATFAAVPAVLLTAALAGIYFPARRASRIEPSSALGYE